MSNLYAVLGVTRRASDQQIKVAFRRLAKTCHPDLHGGDKGAEQRFKEISRAYETLGDAEARAGYDKACAEERARTRRRQMHAAATMSASFLFTLSSGLLVGLWLRSDGLF
jgi:curved DNA-binding protein CbpA